MQGWWKFICFDHARSPHFFLPPGVPPPHSGQHNIITPIHHTSLSYSLRGRWTPSESILPHHLCNWFVCLLSLVFVSCHLWYSICHVCDLSTLFCLLVLFTAYSLLSNCVLLCVFNVFPLPVHCICIAYWLSFHSRFTAFLPPIHW